jgi:hypothetical protein
MMHVLRECHCALTAHRKEDLQMPTETSDINGKLQGTGNQNMRARLSLQTHLNSFNISSEESL